MLTYRLSALLLLLLLTLGCKTSRMPAGRALPTTATLVDEGLVNCFAASTSLNGQPVTCEVSAVLFDQGRVWLANDKDVPAALSPVFTKSLSALPDSTQAPAYLMSPAFATGHKYEDFSRSPNGRFVFLTTAFDRVKDNGPEWDGYNTVLYWPKDDEQHPRVLAPDDSSTSSVAYRRIFSRVLADTDFPDSVPYFKVEGLAVTQRHLLFGVREMGKSFSSFLPEVKVVAVTYRAEKTALGERIHLGDDWRVVATFKPSDAEPTLPKPLSLSSLEYDPEQNCFWMLTSLEAAGQPLDAYLWVIKPDDLLADKPFTLIRDAQGQPFHFGHKAEDLTPIGNGQLLVIHDDDRILTTVNGQTRQPNQAAYSIIRFR